VKTLLTRVNVIHTVDSEKLALEISRRWAEAGRGGKLPLLIEVNVDGEKDKSGTTPEAAPGLAKTIAALAGIELLGLMCIPSPAAREKAFARLRTLESSCRPATQGTLSMGMSDDFELAIREGATHVRIGTAIFGSRT